VLVQDNTYGKLVFKETPLAKAEYENCTFDSCDFSEADISGYKFIDCKFINCNISMAKLDKTALKDVAFKGCKMLGLHFNNCYGFGLSFSFENCAMDYCSFYNTRIKRTRFEHVTLRETDFTGCDISGALFNDCDCNRAVFDNTVLENADMRGAYNYIIDPDTNRIKGAKFSVHGVAGLLAKYDIVIE
jgi:uncharacterized protein YjbI with pentapeptide repeats